MWQKHTSGFTLCPSYASLFRGGGGGAASTGPRKSPRCDWKEFLVASGKPQWVFQPWVRNLQWVRSVDNEPADKKDPLVYTIVILQIFNIQNFYENE